MVEVMVTCNSILLPLKILSLSETGTLVIFKKYYCGYPPSVLTFWHSPKKERIQRKDVTYEQNENI
jgi:hypothetical protein